MVVAHRLGQLLGEVPLGEHGVAHLRVGRANGLLGDQALHRRQVQLLGHHRGQAFLLLDQHQHPEVLAQTDGEQLFLLPQAQRRAQAAAGHGAPQGALPKALQRELKPLGEDLADGQAEHQVSHRVNAHVAHGALDIGDASYRAI